MILVTTVTHPHIAAILLLIAVKQVVLVGHAHSNIVTKNTLKHKKRMNIFYRIGGFTNIEFENIKIENRAIFHYHQDNPETISDNNY